MFEREVVVGQSYIGPTGEVNFFCATKDKSLVGTLAIFVFRNMVCESAGEPGERNIFPFLVVMLL
jgi:hypothetical protein